MGLDLAVLAAVLSGLAVGVWFVAVMPRLTLRRAMSRRLVDVLGADQPTAPTRTREARRGGWSLDAARVWLTSSPYASFSVLGGLGLVLLLLTRDPILALAGCIECLVFLTLLDHDLVAARHRLLDAQTLPTLLRISASLRAGASLHQAMETIAQDGPAPTREEFQRVLDEVALGTSLDDALSALADRAGTEDYEVLSIVLSVQRRVGGNLAIVLDNLADTVRQRVELRQEIAALTAQQRLSTWVLVLLPLLTTFIFLALDRGFLEPLLTTTYGRLMILVGTVMQAIGAWTLRRVSRVET